MPTSEVFEVINLVARGRVVNRAANQGVADVTVTVLDPGALSPATITAGEGQTLADGTFAVAIADVNARELLTSGRRAFLRVTAGDVVLLDQPEEPRWSPATAGVSIKLPIGGVSATPVVGSSGTPSVSGTVVYSDGRPDAHAVVRVRQHQKFGTLELDLGAAQTDAHGAFSILYTPVLAGAADAGQLVLEVRAEDHTGVLVSTGLLTNAPSDLRVTLKRTDNPSSSVKEHTSVQDKVEDLLQSTLIESLQPTGLALLSKQTAIPLDQLTRVVAAKNLADAASTKGATILSPTYYAMLKHGLPEDPLAATAKSAQLDDVVAKAMQAGDLDFLSGTALTAYTLDLKEKLTKVAAHDMLKAADGTDTPLTALLSPVLDADQRAAVASAWVKHPTNASAVWTEAGGAAAFSGEDVAKRRGRLALELGQVAGWEVPVAHQLLGQVGEDEETLASLAGQPLEWWSDQVAAATGWTVRPMEGETSEEALDRYAKSLKAQIDRSYPSAQLKARIIAEDEYGSDDLRETVAMEAFGDFDFGKDDIDAYATLKGMTISSDVKDEIRKTQRLYAIDPTYETIKILDDAEVNSAQDLGLRSTRMFAVAAPSLEPQELEDIHDIAQQGTVASLAMWQRLNPNQDLDLPGVPSARATATVKSMFGQQGGCECDACGSVLGPAAYLADLASYLTDGVEVAHGSSSSSGWATLTGRRPDLPSIQMSCASSLETLPHIDIVNEILERSVTNRTYRTTVPASVPLPVLEEFDPLTAGSPPSLPHLPEKSSEELGAYPQETWYPALRTLALPTTRFGRTLPFDRPTVEARLYLDDLAAPLAAVLDATALSPTVVTTVMVDDVEREGLEYEGLDMRTALEILGFTAADAAPFEIIGINAIPFRTAWGLSSGDDRDDLVATDSSLHVGLVVERLGVTFDEFKRVAATSFVSRFAAMTVTEPVNCDMTDVTATVTSSNAVSGVTPTPTPAELALEGLQRFLRLQRRLDWSIEETDFALYVVFRGLGLTSGAPIFNADVWRALAVAVRWCHELRLRPVEMLTFWSSPADLSTHSAFTAPLGSETALSLYQSLFVRRTSRTDTDAFFASLPTGSSSSFSSSSSPTLFSDDQVRTILGVLGVSWADLGALSGGTRLATKQTVWRWFCRARLAHALRVPVADACWILDRLAVDPARLPYGGATGWRGWESFGDFVRYARVWKSLHLSATDAGYLLGNNPDAVTPLRKRVDAVKGFLRTLRASLQEVVGRTLPFTPTTADAAVPDALEEALGRVLYSDARSPLMEQLAGATLPSGVARVFLDEALRPFLWEHEIEALHDADGPLGPPAARQRFLLGRLTDYAALPGAIRPSYVEDVRLFDDLSLDDVEFPGELKETFRAWLPGSMGGSAERDAVDAVVDALFNADDLTTEGGEEIIVGAEGVMNAVLGAAFWGEISNVAHDTEEEALNRLKIVLRTALLRMSLQSQLGPDQLTSVLDSIHRPEALSDGGDSSPHEALLKVVRMGLADVLTLVPAASSQERECRRQALLVALVRKLPSPTLALQDSVGTLVAQVLGLPYDAAPPVADPAKFVRRFTEGVSRSTLYGPFKSGPGFVADDLLRLGLGAEADELLEENPPPPESEDTTRRWPALLALSFSVRLRDAESDAALRAHYATWLGVSPERADALFDVVKGAPAGGGSSTVTAGSVFLNAGFVSPTSSTPEFTAEEFLTDERLRKTAAIVDLLRLRAGEPFTVEGVTTPCPNEFPAHEHWASHGLLSLAEVSVGSPPTMTVQGTNLLGLLRAVEVRSFRSSLLPTSTQNPYDLLDKVLVGTDAAVTDVKLLTGWDFSPDWSADRLMTPAFLGASADVAYDLVGLRVRRRIAAQALQRKVGVNRVDLVTWADGFRATTSDAFTTRLVNAQAIRGAARALRGERAWLTRSRPLIDALRQRQRDALVDYHLAQDALPTPDALFEEKLIDTQMSCCRETTRTLQAISSAQIFAHRCLMNIEPGATVHTGTAGGDYVARWEWMKQYRVWEANRKVFLYPENWIDPTLRRDKTEFFRDFESAIQQSDLNDESIRSALSAYLHKLDGVARLDVRAITSTTDEHGVETLHLIARTANPPHVYWYRTRVRGNRWTHWQKINAQIEGDTLTAAVLKGRLHLFWLRTEIREVKNEGAGANDAPTDHLFYQVAYMRREGAGWGAPRYSQEKFEGDTLGNNPDLEVHESAPLGIVVDLWNPRDPEVAALIHVVIARSTGELGIRGADWGDFGLCHVLTSLAFRSCTGAMELWNEEERFVPLLSRGGRFGFYLFAYEPGHDYSTYNIWNFNPDVLHDAAPTGSFIAWGPYGYGGVSSDQCVQMTPGAALTLRLAHQGDPDGVPTDLATTPSPFSREGTRWRVTTNRCLRTSDQNLILDRDPIVARDGFQTFLVEAVACRCETTIEENNHIDAPSLLRTRANEPPSPPTSIPMVFTYINPVDDPDAKDESFAKIEAQGYNASAAQILEVGSGAGMALKSTSAPPLRTSVQPYTYTSTAPSQVQLTALHHRHTCSFIDALEIRGLDGLYDPSLQFPVPFGTNGEPTNLESLYHFDTRVRADAKPTNDLDFDNGTPFGIYNSEVFFHIPFLIAQRLQADQQFERAEEWLHRIFNPLKSQAALPTALTPWVDAMDEAPPEKARYWRYRPFLLAELRGQERTVSDLLDDAETSTGAAAAQRQFNQQMGVWLENPFDPHSIAAVRPRAYEFSMVMRYLDNLLNWGDALFRASTRESVDEATLVYVRASAMLGVRPVRMPPPADASPQTLLQVLQSTRDGIGSAMEDASGIVCSCGPLPPGYRDAVQLVFWQHFCVPMNDRIVGYWDRVAERLFKIRHCLNIDGVRTDLALFEPPIDPALLVRAAALGVNLQTALSQGLPTLATWRFQPLLQRALEFTGDVRSLASQLLSALEKRDAEELTQIRAGHELALLDAGRAVRRRQVDEARAQLDALDHSLELATFRRDYYASLEKYNQQEVGALLLSEVATGFQTTAQLLGLSASGAHAEPDVIAGPCGVGVIAAAKYGGSNIGASIEAMSKALSVYGQLYQSMAGILSTQGGYERRWADWQFQKSLAAKEIGQVTAQKVAAQIRIDIAENEMANFEMQVENSREVDDFVRGKFTSTELYAWMVGEVATLYRESYQMAFDLARKAERAYQFERLPTSPAAFINFGQWDSLRSGLLAGERLQRDLRKMEKAYLDTDVREYELTRHFSLIQVDPFALLRLREGGACEFTLAESLFDRDYPGHYFRRIKSVSVSIPAVVGPYGGVHARLTLVRSVIRTKPIVGQDQEYREGIDDTAGDDRFVHDLVPVQSIVTSSGQSDGGVFQLDLRSDRLLPFEGAGAANSGWRLELDPSCNSFDTRAITDVVLHVQYTAREGGEALRQAAMDSLQPGGSGSSGGSSGGYEGDGSGDGSGDGGGSSGPEMYGVPDTSSGLRFQVVSLAQNAPEALHQFRLQTGPERTIMPGALRPRLGFVPRTQEASLRGVWVVLLLSSDVTEFGGYGAALERDEFSMEGEPDTVSPLSHFLPGEAGAMSVSVAPHYVAAFMSVDVLNEETLGLYDHSDWQIKLLGNASGPSGSSSSGSSSSGSSSSGSSSSGSSSSTYSGPPLTGALGAKVLDVLIVVQEQLRFRMPDEQQDA